MVRIKFGVTDAIEAEPTGGKRYEGPVPPRGVYRGVLKRLGIKNNAKGNPMLYGMIEFRAKAKSPDAKYDGYGLWLQQNVTDQGKGFVNQFLDALTDGTDEARKKLRTQFWNGGIDAEKSLRDGDPKSDGGHISRLGSLKVNSPEGSIPILVSTKLGADLKGNERLEVDRYLTPRAEEPDEEEYDEEVEDEDGEDESASEADADGTDEEDVEDDESEEEDDEDEPEEEPEPVAAKRRPAKKAAALF